MHIEVPDDENPHLHDEDALELEGEEMPDPWDDDEQDDWPTETVVISEEP